MFASATPIRPLGEQRADGHNAAAANPLGLINDQEQPGSYGPPSFGVTNYANPGSTEGTDIVREGLMMGTETISIQKGKHQISAGFNIRYEPIYMYEDWAATPFPLTETTVATRLPTSCSVYLRQALQHLEIPY
jgi:hypothetical protein